MFNSKIFAFVLYIILLLGLFIYKFVKYEIIGWLITLYLFIIPLLFTKKIQLKLNIKELYLSVCISILILFPLFIGIILLGFKPISISLKLLIFHLFFISVPEEMFFRGYIQEIIGNTYSAIVITSFLFMLSHIPISLNYLLSTLTFFPSLLMGYLYMKTKNLLYSIIFHFMANILFISYFN